MRNLLNLLLTACLAGLPGGTLHAGEPPPWPAIPRDQADLERFARARFDDARQLLSGPVRPQVAAPAEFDCVTLYQRRVALTTAQLDYRTPFWDDPRNQAGVFVGAIWTPAFYYLPYRAIAEFRERAQAPHLQVEIDQLRATSAALRCFER